MSHSQRTLAHFSSTIASESCFKWFNLGKTQGKVASASSLEESVASYVRALRLQPGWVPVWESLGSAFEAAGRSAEARHSFGRAAELKDPKPKGPGTRAAQAPPESGEGAEEAAEARRRANAASAADLVNLAKQ